MKRSHEWIFACMSRYGFEANRVSRRLVLVVLAAWGVTSAGLMQQPTYEASALMLVGWNQGNQWANWGESGEEIQTLEYRGEPPTLEIMQAVASRSVAQEAIQRLKLPMEPGELLENLTAEQAENTQFIRISYEDPDPQRAKRIVNSVGAVASELASDSGEVSVEVWRKAALPYMPVSPHPWRNGLLTLIVGLALSSAPIAPARDALAAAAGELGEYVRVGVQAAAQAGVLRRQRRDRSIAERVKEKKLLKALGRCGKLTAVEAALATGLSVEECHQILWELALRGQLEMSVERGSLLYAFWDKHAA